MKIIILTRHTSFNLADKKNIIKKYDPRVIDKITYSYIKILEKNIKLENEVKKIRKKLHIPSNGFTLKEYDHFIKTEMKLVMNKNVMEASNPTKRAIKLLDNARKESYKINDLFNIHPAIATSTQFLILFNGVYVSNIDIQIVGSVDDYLTQAEDETLFNIDSIKIIVSKVVKKNQLIRFIKDNWKEIELEMKNLQAYWFQSRQMTRPI